MKQQFMRLSFGYLIRAYCERNKIGYKELSLYADCSESHLARLAYGQVNNPDLEILLRVADCIEIDIREMFQEAQGWRK